ncbi:hypothetical protein TNCT_15711 [Trichonephila clavata]|uniref:Uncharacterized protein n=1 Tax=Trichonephila clavata TaxID=2740835 RepID=A0A8X6H156_TRICU|nr:hypothetical protein TNCT_15711 [Trichonephila clavata]
MILNLWKNRAQVRLENTLKKMFIFGWNSFCPASDTTICNHWHRFTRAHSKRNGDTSIKSCKSSKAVKFTTLKSHCTDPTISPSGLGKRISVQA